MKLINRHWVIALCCVLTLFSCSEPLEEELTTANQEEFTVAFLKKNDIASNLMNSIGQIKYKPQTNKSTDFDSERFLYLAELASPTSHEILELEQMIIDLGYESLDHYNQVQYFLTELGISIHEETTVSTLSQEEVYAVLLAYAQDLTLDSRNCYQDRILCGEAAEADLLEAAVNCVGGGVSVGAVTGGLGGVIFGSFCLVAATLSFNADIAVCNNSYDQCQDR